jgi:hypothetical protein
MLPRELFCSRLLLHTSSGGHFPIYTEGWDVSGDHKLDSDWHRVKQPQHSCIVTFTSFMWAEEGSIDAEV